MSTSTVDVPTADGVADAIYAAPTGTQRHPGVLLYMDIFGLRDQLRSMAAKLAAAASQADRVAATAGFHGGRLATDAPDSPHRLLDRIRAEVYLGHADNDGSMPPEQQQRLDDALAAAGVTHRTELYQGAAHGYTM